MLLEREQRVALRRIRLRVGAFSCLDFLTSACAETRPVASSGDVRRKSMRHELMRPQRSIILFLLLALGVIGMRAAEEEVIQFASVMIVGPAIKAGSSVDKSKATELAEFYRDQIFKGQAVSFDKEEASGYRFVVGGKNSTLVDKSGKRITTNGFATLIYIGTGLWCLRIGE